MASPARRNLTIAQVLALVAAAACGMAALRNPTRLSSDLLLDLSLMIAVTAGIVGACGRGRARAFWAGYAIASSGYLLTQLVAVLPNGAPSKVYRSLPTRLLDSCFETLPLITMTASSNGPSGQLIWDVTRPSGERFTYVGRPSTAAEQAVVDKYFEQVDLDGYRRLGHAVFALIAGTAGGMLGLAVAPRGPSPEGRPVPDHGIAPDGSRA